MSEDKKEEIDLKDRSQLDKSNGNANHEREGKAQEGEKGVKDSYWARLRRAMLTRPHLFIIFIISVLGFCYHFHIALNQYWEYKTTVTVSYEDPVDYKFQYPSATFCFQDVAPYYKLIEQFPEYKEAVDKVTEEMKKRNDSLFWNKPETKSLIDIGGLKLEGLHLHKYFEEKIFRNNSILSILEKYSHSQHEECLLDSKPATTYGYKINNCENVTKPMETINGEFRCFTYFLQLDSKDESHANDNDDNFMTSIFISSKTFERRTNKVYYVSHALDYGRLSHPFERDLRARISIHPSDMIPVPEFYPTISLYQYSRFYVINFHKTISHMLESPYKTNCFKYDLGNPKAVQSYDDCFTKCVMNRYRQKCRCLPRSGLLYRGSLLTPDDMFCGAINKCGFFNYRKECHKECQLDCVEEKYDFEKFVDIPFYKNDNLTGIQISRKPVFDQVYRHSPATTFIDLICDFGGLGGLWLGFSVISITTAIISLMAKPLEKIAVVKVKENEEEKKRKRSKQEN